MASSSGTNGSGWVRDRLAIIQPPRDWQPSKPRAWASLAGQRDLSRSRRGEWIWIAAAVAVAALAVAVSQSAHSSLRPLTAKLERKFAPDFLLKDSAGRSVRLSEFRGKVILLNFWATWCIPCQAEIPWFVEFQQVNPGLVVLGVSLDEQGWDAVQPYIQAKHVNYRVMLGNNEVTGRYGGVASLPTTFLIDKSGQIAMTHVSLCGKSDYESEIRALLAER